MITVQDVQNAIYANFGSAVNVRTGKTNYIAIPTGEYNDKGQPACIKVAIGMFATTATKTHEAFDLNTATAEYAAWEKDAVERNNKPKATKGDTESSRRQRERMDKLRAYLVANHLEKVTATDVRKAVFADDDSTTIMAVGGFLAKFVEGGFLNVEVVNGKKTYTSAE